MLRVLILSLLAALLLPALVPVARAVDAQAHLSPDNRLSAPVQPGAALENEESEEDLEVERDLPVTLGLARPPVFRARRHVRPVAAIRPASFLRPTRGRAPPVVV